MKQLMCAVCCVSLFSIPALAQTKSAAMTDQQFVTFAAQTDMVEANLGQLAQQVGGTQQIKDYGQMLVTDHTADYKHLQDIAQQNGFTVPTSIDAANNKAMIGPFHKLKGAAFDRRFAHDMVAGHTGAVALFKKEATDAQSDVIKAYAQADVPVLEKHLSHAKQLGKTK